VEVASPELGDVPEQPCDNVRTGEWNPRRGSVMAQTSKATVAGVLVSSAGIIGLIDGIPLQVPALVAGGVSGTLRDPERRAAV